MMGKASSSDRAVFRAKNESKVLSFSLRDAHLSAMP